MACYEDFMPGKDSEKDPDSKNQGALKGGSSSPGSLPEFLTKEDWIEVLASALKRSSAPEPARQTESAGEGAEGSDSEDQKVLGALASNIAVKPVSKRSQSKPAKKQPLSGVEKKKPQNSSALKKKLAALQRAQLQLSKSISSALEDLG